MTKEEAKQAISANILDQARLYLDDAGEFYPFATVLEAERTIRPVGAYSEEEHPRSEDLLELLSAGIVDGLRAGRYVNAAIAVDVLVTVDGEKVDALEMRYYWSATEMEKFHFRYARRDDGFHFTPL